MATHIVPLRTYILVWVALMILLALTVALDSLDLGWGNTVVAMTIAVVKALLVACFFMHLYYGEKLTRVFAAAGIFWLFIMITLALCDFTTR